jgi:RNase H-like domain found in reverse transcriptase
MIQTGASIGAKEGVLCQIAEDQEAQPISNNILAFYSKILTPSKSCYTAIELELLAIVAIVKTYRHVLLSRKQKILIITDHKNLEKIQSFRITKLRHTQWFEILNKVSFEIKYIQKEKNLLCDILSRPTCMRTHCQFPDHTVLNAMLE